MEVKKLVCDICGGQIEIQSGGKGVCTSCGTPYSAEIIKEKIQEISGAVKVERVAEIVKDDVEKEHLLNMANDCLNKGDFDEARSIYTTVSIEYLDDWRGWWGIICSTPLSEDLTPDDFSQSTFHTFQNTFLDDEFKMALSFAPNDQRSMINQYRQQLLKKIEKIRCIKEIKYEIKGKEGLIRHIQTTVDKEEKELNKIYTAHVIGVVFVVVAIVMFFAIRTFLGTVISIAVLILGIFIWNLLGNGEHEREIHKKSLSEINDVKLKKETLEKALYRFQNELDK